jgi:hypothetical protein
MTADDWVKVIGAIGSASVLIIGALGAVYLQVRKTHQLVNSRMTELLDLTRKSSLAEGKLEQPTTS